MPRSSDLISTAEAARILNVSPGRVRQLRSQRRDFPAPALVMTLGLLWDRRSIEQWAATADRSPHRHARSAD